MERFINVSDIYSHKLGDTDVTVGDYEKINPSSKFEIIRDER